MNTILKDHKVFKKMKRPSETIDIVDITVIPLQLLTFIICILNLLFPVIINATLPIIMRVIEPLKGSFKG